MVGLCVVGGSECGEPSGGLGPGGGELELVPTHLFHLNLPSIALSDAATPLFLIYVIIYLLFFVYIIFI